MKIIKELRDVKGKRRVLVELDQNEFLRGVKQESHYRLGQPVDDVVASHVLMDSQRVYWCSTSQAWVTA